VTPPNLPQVITPLLPQVATQNTTPPTTRDTPKNRPVTPKTPQSKNTQNKAPYKHSYDILNLYLKLNEREVSTIKKTKQLSTQMTPKMYAEFSEACNKTGETKSEVIRACIRKYIKENKG